MKVGDLVRHRRRRGSDPARPPALGFITERVDQYKIRVRVFNSKHSWYHWRTTIAWDESHWEVVSESR